MATATKTKLGPADHGVELSYDEFMAGDYEEGFKYELIDGRLYVSPMPNPDENFLEEWLGGHLRRYRDEHPETVKYVTSKPRVFVEEREETTCPEPDLAVYSEYPHHLPLRRRRWQKIHPMLVIEIMTRDAWKDMVRNVELYFLAPTIREYWVLDARKDPDRPDLIQHVRRGNRWAVREHPFGSTFTTKLLPGFELVIDPR